MMLDRQRFALLRVGLTLTSILVLWAFAQFEQPCERLYQRALWNFTLRDNLKALDIEFNGVDFGHSNLYENLLLTGVRNVLAIEEGAGNKRFGSFIHGQS